MNNTLAGCKTDFVEVLPAVNAGGIAITFYLEYFKSL
jgi:hypothetical protein